MHWHIDYLLKSARIKEIRVIESSKADECNLSDEISLLSGADILANRFGATDCNCKTHLYFFTKKPQLIHPNQTSNVSILKKMETHYKCKQAIGKCLNYIDKLPIIKE